MGISVLTTATICNRDDLLVSHAGPVENGKFIGWITLPHEQYCRPLLNTEPVFDSAESAEQHMRDLMSDIRQDA